MKTCSVKAGDIKNDWFIIDATDQTLGRMATQIAYVLRGKHKPTFVRHLNVGDHVVVINAEKIKLTGRKWDQKQYYRHSNFIGGIKSVSAQQLLESHPERIIYHAVKGMLPGSKLGREVFKNLRVYKGVDHPHAAQKPSTLPSRMAGGK